MNMRILVALLFCIGASASSAQEATYRVVIEGLWNDSQSNPYPASAHFTDFYGVNHSSSALLWKAGELASRGIEDVAEIGVTSSLEFEVNQLQQAGLAGNAIRLSSLFNLPNSTQTTIRVSVDKSRVSLISMVAPSPDWFVGISGVDLRSSNGWRSVLTLSLVPYDAGTEEGNQFSLFNAATVPAEPIERVGNDSPFLQTNPVLARVRFELLESDPEPTEEISSAAVSAVISQLLLSD